MHHFGVFHRPDQRLDSQYISALEGYIRNDLIFRPERVTVTRVGAYLVASFMCNLDMFNITSLIDFDDNEAILIVGLPTFERFDPITQRSAQIEPAKSLRQQIKKTSFQASVSKLGGVFSVVYVSENYIFSCSTFCGYGALYHTKHASEFAISNRMSLIRACSPKGYLTENYLASSWLYTTTMLLSHETPYQEINKIPADHFGTYNGTTFDLSRCEESFDICLEEVSPKTKTEEIEKLIDRYSYYLGLPVNWTSHITGGKDSRAP